MEEEVGSAPSGQALVSDQANLRCPAPPGFDPSLVRLRGVRDDIRGVAVRFMDNHGNNLDRQAPWKPGFTKRQIYDALKALDLETASPGEVTEIIGNASWVGRSCDLCSARQEVWLEIGDDPDWEARWLDICLPCAEHIGAIAMETRRAETENTGSVAKR